MKIVDTKGQLCPAPLIATKRALKECHEGESFELLTDNQTSYNNVSRFLNDNNTAFTSRVEDGVWILTISKGSVDFSAVSTEEYCTDDIAHFQKGNFVVAITSDRMGEGDPELGELLIANFIKALKDLDKLPQNIIFYNKGVTLVTSDSPLISHIRDLEQMGVGIYLCATCVNHYGLAERVGAGILGNMFTIAEMLASAGHVIRP
jgi:selenium metabolism protein YedF